MGRLNVRRNPSPEAVREFARAVVRDVEALEEMLARGMLETGARRIGAEQEVFLANSVWNPAPVATELLAELDDAMYTAEIARFNLEINLPPLEAGPELLAVFRRQLEGALQRLEEVADRHDTHVILTGILPTLTKTNLGLDNIVPTERYYALNDAVMKLCGGRIRLRLQGIDELQMEHDSVMVESCNTSFQVHLQVDPDRFAAHYNVAQAVLGPVLAAAVNSPMFSGMRLWRETRIALFKQAVDTRPTSPYPRERLPRVWFGESWVRESAAELFHENILRYRLLLAADLEEDPLAVLSNGGTPQLGALQLHNGTIYRWNRPCYGVLGERPHLRIECRALPSGPTIIDEIANAAFWIGLVAGGPERFGDVRTRMKFDQAKANFIAAARLGLDAGFEWFDGEHIGAQALIREHLVPAARDGLVDLGVDPVDVDYYLGVIDDRVGSGTTGARWLLRSDRELRECCGRAERLTVLVAEMHARARDGEPVHRWSLVSPPEHRQHPRYERVESCMTTDLYTVRPDDAVDVVAFIMNQSGVRQLLVEDDDGRLVGLISYRSLLRLLALGRLSPLGTPVPVKDIMVSDILTVEPTTPTVDAIRLMRENNISALPVVEDNHLVGIVTEHDFLPVLAQMLEEQKTPADPD